MEVERFGLPVRVEFTKTDGVISHTILLVNNGEKVPALTSRINVPGQPCFTELHQQDDLLFLTGADGPCHWSMSVESQPALERPGIVFDVACRIKESTQTFTEYLALVRNRLSIDPADETTKVEYADDLSVRIQCTSIAPVVFPATVRWKYYIH